MGGASFPRFFLIQCWVMSKMSFGRSPVFAAFVVAAGFALYACNVSLDDDGEGAAYPPVAAAHIERARVTWVIDGDTIQVLLDGQTRSVRLIGVDAPEATGGNFDPLGLEAADFLRGLIPVGSYVFLVRVPGDAYDGGNYSFDRLRRHVWLSAPSNDPAVIRRANAGARLVLAGYARVTGPALANMHRALFLGFESEARAAGRGIHGL